MDSKILQQNIGHRKLGLAQFQEHMLASGFQIGLVQEPYLFDNISIPSSGSFIISCTNPSPRAAIYSSLPSTFLSHLSSRDICVCEILFGGVQITFVSVYLPSDVPIDMHLYNLQTIISSVHGHIIIGGDFNSHHTVWGSKRSSQRGRELLDFIHSNDLFILNRGDEPTFWTDRAGVNFESNIDLTLVSSSLLSFNWNWLVSDIPTASDHRFIEIQIARDSEPHATTTRRWRTTNVDWSLFRKLTGDSGNRWKELLLNSSNSQSIDSSVCSIMLQLKDICNQSLPLINFRRKTVPWWTHELEVMKKRTRYWWNKYRRARDPGPSACYRQCYMLVKRKYEDAIIEAKKRSWKDYLETQDRESVWSKAYRLCKYTSQSCPSTMMKMDGSSTANSEQTSIYLLDTFFPDDSLTEDNCDHTITRRLAYSSAYNAADDVPFNESEIRRVVMNLNDKKAPGIDGFSGNIVKNLFISMPHLITLLYNQCLKHSSFPSWFKISRVIIIPKHNDVPSTSIKAWRPISLISVFGKVLEKLWINRINFSLRSSKLLSDKQFGFVPQKSTIDPIDLATNFILSVKREKKFGVLISLDISSAFDSAWWPAIVLALKKRNVPANLVTLAYDYFDKRKVEISFGVSRHSKYTSRGCPQGSACAPGLWNLLYDDVLRLDLPVGCSLWSFADDLMLAVQGSSLGEVEWMAAAALRAIFCWGESIKLRFNGTKTKVMPIHVRRSPDNPRIVINGVVLENVREFKYLGVVLDSKCNWKGHYKLLASKSLTVYNKIARVARNTFGLKSNVCIQIYNQAIEPMILYAVQCWGMSLSYSWAVGALNRLQRLFLLRACKAYRSVSHEALCIIADSSPLDLRAKELIEWCLVKTHGCINDLQLSLPKHILVHPSTIINFTPGITMLSSLEPRGLHFFTDGSKSMNGVGSAFVVYLDGIEIDFRQYKLSAECSIFQAELFAIEMALKWADTSQACTIFTDSRSSIDAISCVNSSNDLVQSIQSILAAFHVTPRIFWIKAHNGHLGNERADELAKSATFHGECVSLKPPISAAKMLLKTKRYELWNTRWISSRKGSGTKPFFPDVPTRRRIRFFEPDFVVTQFATNHGKFNEYLHGRKIKRSPSCPCGGDQSAIHLICTCPLFVNIRPLHTYPLHQNFCSENSYSKFCKFIKLIHNQLISWE